MTVRFNAASQLYAIAKLVCLAIGVTVIVLDIASIPTAYHVLQMPCSPCDPNSIQFTRAQVAAIRASNFDVHTFALYALCLIILTQTTFGVTGALLFIRRSDDRMALFTALMLVTFGGAAFTGTLHALPEVNGLWWLPTQLLNVVGQTAFFTFCYLFPSGGFVPRWTVVPAAVWAFSWVAPIFHNPTVDSVAAVAQSGWLFLALILTIPIAQVYRYRRVSTPHQRQQTKWVVYGVGVCLLLFAGTLFVGNSLLPESVRDSPVGTLFGNTVTYLYFLLIPITIAVAVLRSRLYDIDVIINRTLVYGPLTAILAAVYFGLVVGAQTLLALVSHTQSGQPPLAIVVSTLVIAALFQPLRRRLQRAIDQRFYRTRYDAVKTVERFAAALRSEVDLSDLHSHLLGVIQDTMQPAHVSLWVREEQPDKELHR